MPFLCLLARYVTHYTTTGVLVEGWHETHVHDSWFGEYGWGEAGGHGHQNITRCPTQCVNRCTLPQCLSLALECKSAYRWFCFPLSLS